MARRRFRVVWQIDIEAETPLEAAQKARLIQLDPADTSRVFEVRDDRGICTDVDLNAPSNSTAAGRAGDSYGEEANQFYDLIAEMRKVLGEE